jgi:hypothetical protein
MPPTKVHFNGSVNLADAATVFDEIATRVPRGLTRIPDGETGERAGWIQFQIQRFQQVNGLEAAVEPADGDVVYNRPPRLRLADGARPDELEWPDLGYATAYLQSWAGFRERRADGRIPAGTRFQVQYPTPLASINQWIVPEQHTALEESYQRALFADLDRVLAEVPHADLAVQWDVAVEFGILEGSFDAVAAHDFDAIVGRIVGCLERVPAEVPAGLHLCYGDLGHQHFVQPESLELQVRLVNSVLQGLTRELSFVSFTVPQDRSDAAYFAPLAKLATDARTELCFGVVPYHPGEQASGVTDAQVAAIDARLPAGTGWAVSTECGLGRTDRADVPGLLDLHREILDAHAG